MAARRTHTRPILNSTRLSGQREQQALAEALPLILSGQLRQIIDRSMPLWNAAEAHRLLE